MSEDQNTPKTDHNYDGIEEYDNPLPTWWLMTFFATIIFGAIYYLHYTFGGASTQVQELEAVLKSLPQVTQKIWNEEDLKNKMDSNDKIVLGKAVYSSKCASCHGNEGQGIIGPNLTDHYWLHGRGSRADLMKVISDGVLEKGMPAWAGLISDDEMMQVAGYIRSLKDSNPPNGKPAQGEEVKD